MNRKIKKRILVFALILSMLGGIPIQAEAAASVNELVTMYVNESKREYEAADGTKKKFATDSCTLGCEVELSSPSTKVISIDNETNTIQGLAAGTTKLYAKCATHGMKVYDVKVIKSEIVLSKTSVQLYTGGGSNIQTFQLKCKKNAAKEDITWKSMDTNVAKVSSLGVITPVGQGTTIINAIAAGKTAASCSVTVIENDLQLSLSNVTVNSKGKGSSIKVIPTIIGPKKSIKWTVEGKTAEGKPVATVSGGTITGKNPGTAKVVASANGVWKSVNVIVNDAADSVSLDTKNITLYNIDGAKQKIVVYKNGNAITTGAWTITDESVVEVTQNVVKDKPKAEYMVTPKKAGETTIRFTDSETGKIDSCKVTVIDPALSLDKNNIRLESKGKNNTQTITASVVGPNNKVTWTVTSQSPEDPKAKAVVTVSKGKVVGKSAGTATIKAVANGKEAICNVTVSAPVLDGIPKSLIISDINETAQLMPNVSGISSAVTYTSAAPAIATVDEDGLITGHNAGKAKITVTANGLSTVCTVTVQEIVTRLNKDYLCLNNVYKKETLKATIKGASKAATWTSSNEEIIKVSPKGVVEVVVDADGNVSGGTANVTLTANGKSDTCAVNVGVVADPKLKSTIVLDQKSAVLYSYGDGNTLQLTPTLTNIAGTVAWSSSNPLVADVDQTGKVTAFSAGSATITAMLGNKKATCSIKVFENSLKLNASALNLVVGDAKKGAYQLKATVKGANTEVTYVSENPLAATVDSDGKITAVDEGNTIIKATANGITAYCDVYVKNVNHEHSFLPENDNSFRASTCTQTGITVHKCNCGYSYSEVMPVNDHSFGSWIEVIPATTTTQGLERRTCAICGYTEERVLTITECTHEFGGETEKTAATCTRNGEMVKVCSICGHEAVRETDRLPHNYETFKETSNGIENGYRANKCSVCGRLEPGTEQYLVQVVEDANASFTVTPESADGYQYCGTDVTISAAVNAGYAFGGWEINGSPVSGDSSLTISNIQEAMAVKAVIGKLNAPELTYDGKNIFVDSNGQAFEKVTYYLEILDGENVVATRCITKNNSTIKHRVSFNIATILGTRTGDYTCKVKVLSDKALTGWTSDTGFFNTGTVEAIDVCYIDTSSLKTPVVTAEKNGTWTVKGASKGYYTIWIVNYGSDKTYTTPASDPIVLYSDKYLGAGSFTWNSIQSSLVKTKLDLSNAGYYAIYAKVSDAQDDIGVSGLIASNKFDVKSGVEVTTISADSISWVVKTIKNDDETEKDVISTGVKWSINKDDEATVTKVYLNIYVNDILKYTEILSKTADNTYDLAGILSQSDICGGPTSRIVVGIQLCTGDNAPGAEKKTDAIKNPYYDDDEIEVLGETVIIILSENGDTEMDTNLY